MKTGRQVIETIEEELKRYNRLSKLEKRIMLKTVNKAKKIGKLLTHFPKKEKELYAEKLSKFKRAIFVHHEIED